MSPAPVGAPPAPGEYCLIIPAVKKDFSLRSK